MLPPPNPTGSSGQARAPPTINTSNATLSTRPSSFHRAPPSSASTSASGASGSTSSSSAGSIPTLGRGVGSWDDIPSSSSLQPAAGPSRPRRGSNSSRNDPVPGVYGHAVEIDRGCLAGKTMRFSLQVAQEPIHGRRKTEKDRRPLAHCPILRFKMREVFLDGEEDDLDVTAYEPGHFICAADLFEVSTSSTTLPIVTDPTHSPASARPNLTTSASSIVQDRPASSLPPSNRRRPSTGEVHPGTDVSMNDSPSPPPPPPHRAASWAADGPAGMAGMSVAARMRAEADFPLAPPKRPPVPSIDSSGSATPHPPSTPVPPVARNSAVARPIADFDDDEKDELIDEQLEDQGRRTDPPSLRPGIQRTVGDRSSNSSGDGDGQSGKPTSKRPKPAATPRPHPSTSSGSHAVSVSNLVRPQRNLFGSLHVPCVRVIAPEGDLGLWFLFTDLTVRQEGTFALRFRVFDITAADKAASASAPVLVEARSQAFKVYSPRNFPGLPKPTELAEHFGRQGFKLNTRKNERQAKTPPLPNEPPSPTDSSHPVRPEAHPIQSSAQSGVDTSTSGSSASSSVPHLGQGSSSQDLSARPGTAGTAGTAGTTSLSGESSAGTVATVATISTVGSSRSKVAPSPLSRSFQDGEI